RDTERASPSRRIRPSCRQLPGAGYKGVCASAREQAALRCSSCSPGGWRNELLFVSSVRVQRNWGIWTERFCAVLCWHSHSIISRQRAVVKQEKGRKTATWPRFRVAGPAEVSPSHVASDRRDARKRTYHRSQPPATRPFPLHRGE